MKERRGAGSTCPQSQHLGGSDKEDPGFKALTMKQVLS